jgi:hypothetical protein
MGGKHEYGVEAPFLCFDNDKFERGGFFVVGIFFVYMRAFGVLQVGKICTLHLVLGYPTFCT